MTTPTLNPDLDYISLAKAGCTLDRPITKSPQEYRDTPVAEFPIIRGWGSAQMTDLEGDIMQETALADLCDLTHGYMDDPDAPAVNTAFVDHQIQSEYILGELIEAQPGAGRTRSGRTVGVMKTAIRTVPTLLHAYETVKTIEAGIPIGESVGFKLLEYTLLKDSSGQPIGISFERVSRREISTCPWPAVQIAWVTSLVKGLKARGALPQDDDLRDLRHVAAHWTELDDPLDSIRLLRLSKRLQQRAVSVYAGSFLGERRYADLPEPERIHLAGQIRDALAIGGAL